eukprot:gene20861-27038_t
MNPIDGEYARGNWGRWNFDGLGPDSKPNITIADIGAVVSLPGCVDQTIHADTSHLYTHVHLPGQTAFVVDTHKLIHSAAVMVDEDGQKALEDKLIRPHLRPGDAVIMDCRLLHFGWRVSYTSVYPITSNQSISPGLQLLPPHLPVPPTPP